MEETDDPTGTPPMESAQCRDECKKIRQGMSHANIRPRMCPRGAADVAAFCRAILESTSVKKIYFRNPDLMESSLGSLSACLSNCKSVEEVELCGRNARSLLPSIVMNDRIRSLTIGFQVEAVDLANTIKTSTGLRRLSLQTGKSSADLHHYSSYSADQIASLAEACRRNQSIEELCLGRFKDVPVGNTLLSNLGPKLTTLKLTSSCDGAAVGSLLRNSQRLRTLPFRLITVTPEDFLAIKHGLSQNFSLRELELSACRISMGDYGVVGDMIRASSRLEKFRFLAMSGISPQAWHSVFGSLAHHPNIRNITLPTDERLVLGPYVTNLLERSTSLQDLVLGDLSGDGIDGLARGLAATTSLVDLKIRFDPAVRVDSFQLLCENGLSQCPTLERLHLSFSYSPLNTGPLARFVKENRTLRCLRLNFDKQTEEERRRALTVLVDAMAFNDVLEEFRLENGTVVDSELSSSLSATLPKLWRLKVLSITNVQLNRHSESNLCQLDLNMSLTKFDVRTVRPGEDGFDEFNGRIDRIIARNQALDASDYGLTAAPSIWPPMIHLALRNEHVGPSMVYRLLSGRSGVVASYVPETNVRPAADDCYGYDDGGASETGIARRRTK